MEEKLEKELCNNQMGLKKKKQINEAERRKISMISNSLEDSWKPIQYAKICSSKMFSLIYRNDKIIKNPKGFQLWKRVSCPFLCNLVPLTCEEL